MPARKSAAEALADMVKSARVDLGWTQEDLADRSGVSLATIKRYENAKTPTPEFDKVRAIVLALGIDTREIPVALGLVTREEMNLPPERPRLRQFDRTTEEILSLLEDPRVSLREKEALAGLLRAQLSQRPSAEAG